MNRYFLYIPLFFSLIFLVWQSWVPDSAQAAPLGNTAQFKELTVALANEELQLFAVLEKSVTEEMKDVLRSGIPLEFTYILELSRTTQGSQEQILSRSFTHTIQYDTLQEKYKVVFEENHNRNNSFSSFETAITALESINGFTITTTEQLIPENNYLLQLKAEFFHKTLPPKMERFLPFLTKNSHTTEWQSVSFRYY